MPTQVLVRLHRRRRVGELQPPPWPSWGLALGCFTPSKTVTCRWTFILMPPCYSRDRRRVGSTAHHVADATRNFSAACF